jgi:plasmid stabilization system protein ParE
MKFQYSLSSEAFESIEKQQTWLEENAGDELADFWMVSLKAALEGLALHPEKNGFAPENADWQMEVKIRQKRFRPWKGKPGWRVLYSVDEAAAMVTILQVRHESMPWVEE